MMIYLYYSVTSGRSDISYSGENSINWETERAYYLIENGKLTVTLKFEADDLEFAKRYIDEELDAWTLKADLRHGIDSLQFTDEQAHVVDPELSKEKRATVKARISAKVSMSLSAHIVKGNYPSPPDFTFIQDPLLGDIVARYKQWARGGEPLPSMLYAVITRMELEFSKDRRTMETELNISRSLLDTLRKLSSDSRGNIFEARKFGNKEPTDYTEQERKFCEAAIRAIIEHLARLKSDLSVDQLNVDTVNAEIEARNR